MRPCKHEKRLEDWFELAEGEREALQRHAESCSVCHERIAALIRVESLIDQGREAYLELRYTGPRPLWNHTSAASEPVWKRPWARLLGSVRPLPTFATAVLVLVLAMAFWRPWDTTPSSKSRETFRAKSVASQDSGVDDPPLENMAEKERPVSKTEPKSPDLETEDSTLRRGRSQKGSGFSRPPGPALTLTAASRAVREELSKRPSAIKPKRPRGLSLSFPKRPIPGTPSTIEVAKQEKAG